MNKKVLLLNGIIILLAVLCYIAFILFAPIQIHKLLPEGCVDLFGVSPEEFMDTEFEFYNETGDFRKHARIDENGKLIFEISKFQELVWKKWLSNFSEYPEKEPFVISSDYKKLDVYISANITPESNEYQAIIQEAQRIAIRMSILQSINGVPDDSIYITYTVIDRDSGEILAQQRCKV